MSGKESKNRIEKVEEKIDQNACGSREVRSISDSCCPEESEDVSEFKTAQPSGRCPGCDGSLRPVPGSTVIHILEPYRDPPIDPDSSYGLCRNRSCDVLYCSPNGAVYPVKSSRVPIGFKNGRPGSTELLCYCFGFSKRNIAEEIESTGKSTAVPWITEQVQNGHCACEHKNPTGQCCLGDVKKTIEEIKKKSKPGSHGYPGEG